MPEQVPVFGGLLMGMRRANRGLRSRKIIPATTLMLLVGALLGGGNPAVAAVGADTGRTAFTSTRDGNFEVYAMNADGTAQTNLTNSAAFDGSHVWSPDGSRIAFQTARDGEDENYVMNADGTAQTRLTINAAFDGEIAW